MWAHQAAEKALKALLVDADIDPPKSCDLRWLAGQVPALPQTVDIPTLGDLNPWAIEGRYPHDVVEATSAQADAAVQTAEHIVRAASRQLTVDQDTA